MPEEARSTSPSAVSNTADSTYFVGTAWRNITPCTKEMFTACRCDADSVFRDSPNGARPSLRASGYNPTGRSILDHDEIPLAVQALAIKDSVGGNIVLVSIDVLNFDRAFSDSVRSVVSARTGLQPNQLLLSATHTHRAPTMLAAHAAGGMPGEV